MNKITEITRQKKHNNLYNIYVDDSFCCSIGDLELSLMHLKVGQILSDDELKKIISSSNYNKTYNIALYYLQYGPRTEYQMRSYLTQKGYESTYIDMTIAQLIADKYIDDLAYASSFIADKQQYRLKSNSYIKAHLIKKGISKTIIKQSLEMDEVVDQVKVIKTLIEKKYHQSNKYQDKQKLTQYLLRQGFKYSDVVKALDEVDLVFGSNEKMYNNSY